MCVYRGDAPAAFDAALRSVLEQELPAHVQPRLYLCADGPLPAALEQVITAHAPQLHRLLRNEQGLGLARSLNRLIASLEDERFVFRMDADDCSLPGRYRNQLEYLLAHEDIDILGTAIIEHDTATGRERVIRFSERPQEALARMHLRVPVAHPSVCMRRRVLELTGGYPASEMNEDVALWFECAARGLRFANLAQPLLWYRLSPEFWRRRGWRKASAELGCYLRGVRRLHGRFTLLYAFPLLRFLMRLLPVRVSQRLYGLHWLRGGA